MLLFMEFQLKFKGGCVSADTNLIYQIQLIPERLQKVAAVEGNIKKKD